MADVDPQLLDRVRALLAKAESTTFEAEAEAFTAKAQELISRHAIDQALLHAADRRGAGEPGVRTIRIPDPYAGTKALLLSAVADANHCRTVWAKPTRTATVIGFPDRLEAVELLFTSLLLQATTAVLATGPAVDGRGRSRTRSFRHAFLTAYAVRVGQRLEEAAGAVESAAATERADLLPVLADQDRRVSQALRARFPQVGTSRVTASNAHGWAEGRRAADRAELGADPRLSGPA